MTKAIPFSLVVVFVEILVIRAAGSARGNPSDLVWC